MAMTPQEKLDFMKDKMQTTLEEVISTREGEDAILAAKQNAEKNDEVFYDEIYPIKTQTLSLINTIFDNFKTAIGNGGKFNFSGNVSSVTAWIQDSENLEKFYSDVTLPHIFSSYDEVVIKDSGGYTLDNVSIVNEYTIKVEGDGVNNIGDPSVYTAPNFNPATYTSTGIIDLKINYGSSYNWNPENSNIKQFIASSKVSEAMDARKDDEGHMFPVIQKALTYNKETQPNGPMDEHDPRSNLYSWFIYIKNHNGDIPSGNSYFRTVLDTGLGWSLFKTTSEPLNKTISDTFVFDHYLDPTSIPDNWVFTNALTDTDVISSLAAFNTYVETDGNANFLKGFTNIREKIGEGTRFELANIEYGEASMQEISSGLIEQYQLMQDILLRLFISLNGDDENLGTAAYTAYLTTVYTYISNDLYPVDEKPSWLDDYMVNEVDPDYLSYIQ
jgi:hypothetical protein